MRTKHGLMVLILVQAVMLSTIASGFLTTLATCVAEEDLTASVVADSEVGWSFDTPEKWSEFAYADSNSAELIIGLSRTHPDGYAELASFITQWGGELVDTIWGDGEIQAVVADLPCKAMSSFVTHVQATGLLTHAEPNFKVWALWEPNDPKWGVQWGPKKIEANCAWNTTKGSHDVLVAVIDTGVDYNHEDLHENYAFDAQGDPLGYDWANNDADPMDDHNHGTHCAGIIAAVLNNSKGIAGVANVTIVAEKVLDEEGSGEIDDIVNGIYHAVDQLGADILSLSLGTYFDSITLHDAVRHAYNNNVLVVAAAGNDKWSRKIYPAAYDEVVAVAATDRNDEPAYFTNFGNWLEVAAPGVNIFSTLKGNQYGNMSGTSMACPHVAGVAALTWSQFPSASRDWLRRRLRLTAVDLDTSGFDIYYGYGRINASGAVNGALPAHDLLVYDWKLPPAVKPGLLVNIKTIVLNFATCNENDVKVILKVNQTIVDYVTINLGGGASATVSLSWTPTVAGKYNVTTCIEPKVGESDVKNNAQSAYVCVNYEAAVRVPQDSSTIMEAINITNNRMYCGDAVIRVASGTYNEENLIADNLLTSLTLFGESRTNTIINGSAGSKGILVKSNYVTITGFTIQNFDKGIVLESILATVRDNEITNNYDGVYLDVFSSQNSVTDNVLSHNIGRYGNGHGIDVYCSIQNTISNNSLYYNDYGIWLKGELSIFNPSPGPRSASTAHLESSFAKFFVTGNKISNNTISNSRATGIYLCYAEENVITGNELSNNNNGNILLEDASSNTISNNKLLNCDYWGICISGWDLGSLYNTIDSNIVLNTTAGVSLRYRAKYNSIVRNTISNNSEVGIEMLSWYRIGYASSNEVVGNNISNNVFGVQLVGQTFGNYIHHNNFVDNTNQASSDPPYINVWDNGYPSGGNYWSNYNGKDADRDGIGDTPYQVDPDEKDNYPLMQKCGLVFRVPKDYATIQEAINAVPSGATILVASGTYYERITINKKLELLGKSSADTTIDGNGANPTVIDVTASGVTIKGFTVRDGYYGVRIYASSQCVIANNVISYNRIGVCVGYSSSSCTIKSNTISNNNQTGISVTGDDCTIIYNVILNTIGYPSSSGILLDTLSYGHHVSQNTIKYTQWGIWIRQSIGNTIANNVISNNSYGIHLDQITIQWVIPNVLYYNHITNNTIYGIAITDCTRENHICHNYISKNTYGIYLDHTSNQTIRRNEISNNLNFGVKSYYSNNNLFYHNNFINNPTQVKNIQSTNRWDYRSEGNYWSDYKGRDGNGDGIGDTPYVIDKKNRDSYPLMDPRSPLLGDVDNDWDVDEIDIDIMSQHFGEQYPTWDPYWGPRCDIVGAYYWAVLPIPDGRVDIDDIGTAIGHFGDTWPPP